MHKNRNVYAIENECSLKLVS